MQEINGLEGWTLPELPKKTPLQKKIIHLARIDGNFSKCHAIKDNGRKCRNDAMTGEVFCHAHLSVGYGLFTLAVIAQSDLVTTGGQEPPKK